MQNATPSVHLVMPGNAASVPYVCSHCARVCVRSSQNYLTDPSQLAVPEYREFMRPLADDVRHYSFMCINTLLPFI